MDYASSMCKACWFNDLMSFTVAWSTIPHSDLSNIFFDDVKKTVKIVQVQDQDKNLPCRVNGMSLFE